ncbi:hypothetical protein [Gordonia alkanivorans]|uniref:hypothetical protein n=1 Tax=Gordonia alkanivorans TaxID=84096 RepID=UPI0004B80D15|nr:hypothetical protein [Gordonia alkanivorans]
MNNKLGSSVYIVTELMAGTPPTVAVYADMSALNAALWARITDDPDWFLEEYRKETSPGMSAADFLEGLDYAGRKRCIHEWLSMWSPEIAVSEHRLHFGDELRAHIDRIAHEAPLPVMGEAGILGLVHDRDMVTDEVWERLTAADVDELYSMYVLDAVNHLENDLAVTCDARQGDASNAYCSRPAEHHGNHNWIEG